ncbi:unnamed protein product [Meloidogyne enterolobii]|uniref:Uncharacterized protein n=2 Tax=Meloidogyne enterolobii TaxID=390850 RepID=A0ACB0Y6W5_MELEN
MGGSSRNKGEGSSSTRRQMRQIFSDIYKNNLADLKKKNKCTGKKMKEVYPSEDTQKDLIEDYVKKNEKFRDALKMTKNLKIKRLLNRFEDEEYKVNMNKMIGIRPV